MKALYRLTHILVFCCLFIPVLTIAAPIKAPYADPHYIKPGFFDVHVCHWPDRPLFFLTLFSTRDYEHIRRIDVYTPDNVHIGQLDSSKFRLVRQKNKKDKRVFLKQFDIRPSYHDGWYRAIITMKDGTQYEALDYVILHQLAIADQLNPAPGAEAIPLPDKLSWGKVPGAKHYQVFIRDLWKEKDIYTSELLDKPELLLPKGLLKAGGYYAWRVHARDVNEHALLGDFNNGSLTSHVTFSIRN